MKDNLTKNTFNESENHAFLVCSSCKNTNIFCKGICQACYSKNYRNTDKGKKRMKEYNLNAGKEAQKKFRERNKANKPTKTPKPPKPPKQNCECGKPSISKNLCTSCYQKKKYLNKKGAIRKKYDGNKIFKEVLAEVKKGLTILNACKKVGFKCSSTLYRLITPAQKAELKVYKILKYVDEDEF